MNYLLQTQNYLEKLPIEVFQIIVSYLNFTELNTLRRVSKTTEIGSRRFFEKKISQFKSLVNEAKLAVTDHSHLDITGYNFDKALERRFTILLAKLGDFKNALEFSNLVSSSRLHLIMIIGYEQLKVGNALAAEQGVEQCESEFEKQQYLLYIAYKRAKHGDIVGAKKMLVEIQRNPIKSSLEESVARVYATLGEFEEVEKIACSLENPSYPYSQNRAISYIAVAKARSNDLEGAKTQLVPLKKIIFTTYNKLHHICGALVEQLANSQIKIQDFQGSLKTIKSYPMESCLSSTYQADLFFKLAKAQLKVGKIKEAIETSNLIDDKFHFIKSKLVETINNKKNDTCYEKKTEYWWGYGSFSLNSTRYRDLYEKLAPIAHLDDLGDVSA